MKLSLLALLVLPVALVALQRHESKQQGRLRTAATTPTPCPGNASEYEDPKNLPDFFPACYPARPRVQFVFAGACNFQVEPGNRVNIWMLDSPETCLGGECGDGNPGRLVQDHRAMLQFSAKLLPTPTPPDIPGCPTARDCLLYDLNRHEVSLGLSARMTGLLVDKSYDDYVASMPVGTTLADDPPYSKVTLRNGVLWATEADYKYHYSNARKPTPNSYQREVILTVGLEKGKKSFAANVKGADKIVFNYGDSADVWIRFLSVPSGEACLKQPAGKTWSSDEDFALNYLLATTPPPTPWPIPVKVVSAPPTSPKPTPLPFCEAAEQLQQQLDAKVKRAAAVNDRVRSSELVKFYMSSMGSDCIGGKWPK